jgi:hypothetical protein
MSEDRQTNLKNIPHPALRDEPYAWEDVNGTIWNHKTSEDDVPLYIKPQWQGLAKLHVKLIAENSPNIEWAIMLTEQALKEKNGG